MLSQIKESAIQQASQESFGIGNRVLFAEKTSIGAGCLHTPLFSYAEKSYEEYSAFNTSLGSAADYELMLRFLVKHQISCAYLSEVLVRMRSGATSNKNLQNRIKANLMDRKAWRANGLQPHPWTLWMKPARKVGQFF